MIHTADEPRFPFARRFYQCLVVLAVVNLLLFIVGFVNAGWEGPPPTQIGRIAGRVATILLSPYFFFRELVGNVPFVREVDELLGGVLAAAAESLVLTFVLYTWYRVREFEPWTSRH